MVRQRYDVVAIADGQPGQAKSQSDHEFETGRFKRNGRSTAACFSYAVGSGKTGQLSQRWFQNRINELSGYYGRQRRYEIEFATLVFHCRFPVVDRVRKRRESSTVTLYNKS